MLSDGEGGSDSATVHITVVCENDPPVAEDDPAETQENKEATVDVLANNHGVVNLISYAVLPLG